MGYRRGGDIGGAGGSLLWLAVWPVAGCWWWLAGMPLFGAPRTGWPRVTLCTVRGLVLLLAGRIMMREAGDPGWGTGVVLACAVAGLVARSRAWARCRSGPVS